MEVLDEAVSLLRRTPLSVLSIYYLGAFPFCLALLYFCFDMTQSADAEAHLPGEVLLLTWLYFWMKTCQAVFARRLLTLLEGEDPEPWSPASWMNTALLQIIYAGSFILVYPAALVITIPFGWVNAFYHNISIVATSARSTVRSSLIEAVELSRLWPKQNHLIMGILLAAFFFLFLNLAVFFSMIPDLLDMFFGVRTVFEENSFAWQNSSFYLEVSVFCFLVLNPLNKAIYALRCFYGRSRLNGADLKAELRRQQAIRLEQTPARILAVTVFLCIAFFFTPIRADDPVIQPAPVIQSAEGHSSTVNLDQAIRKTLEKDEFSWRLPRPKIHEKEGVISRILHQFLKYVEDKIKKMFDAIGDFLKWLFDLDKKHDPDDKAAGPKEIPWRLIFLVALVLIVGCLTFLLVRYLRRQKNRLAPSVLAAVPVRTVDLEADNVRADDLPEDSWLAMAHQLIERGELRLALRALYLATLSVLARSELVRLGAAKSNRDYLLELTRRLRGNGAAIPFFRENIHLFEASWYGTHAVTSAIIETMLANHQQVRSHATT